MKYLLIIAGLVITSPAMAQDFDLSKFVPITETEAKVENQLKVLNDRISKLEARIEALESQVESLKVSKPVNEPAPVPKEETPKPAPELPKEKVEAPAKAKGKISFYSAEWCASCQKWKKEEYPQFKEDGWEVEFLDGNNLGKTLPYLVIEKSNGQKFRAEGYFSLNFINSL